MSREPLRLFVSIDLPEVARPRVSAEVEALRAIQADVRWVPSEQLHLTLKFLGGFAAERLAPLCGVLGAIPSPPEPLELELRGLGRFPPAGRGAPRVIWAGLAGADLDALVGLAAAVDRACATLGVAVERRGFSPHLTLGRVRSSRGLPSLEAEIEARAEAFVVPLPPIDQLRLYRSELRAAAAEHTLVQEFRIGDPPRP